MAGSGRKRQGCPKGQPGQVSKVKDRLIRASQGQESEASTQDPPCRHRVSSGPQAIPLTGE